MTAQIDGHLGYESMRKHRVYAIDDSITKRLSQTQLKSDAEAMDASLRDLQARDVRVSAARLFDWANEL